MDGGIEIQGRLMSIELKRMLTPEPRVSKTSNMAIL